MSSDYIGKTLPGFGSPTVGPTGGIFNLEYSPDGYVVNFNEILTNEHLIFLSFTGHC